MCFTCFLAHQARRLATCDFHMAGLATYTISVTCMLNSQLTPYICTKHTLSCLLCVPTERVISSVLYHLSEPYLLFVLYHLSELYLLSVLYLPCVLQVSVISPVYPQVGVISPVYPKWGLSPLCAIRWCYLLYVPQVGVISSPVLYICVPQVTVISSLCYIISKPK